MKKSIFGKVFTTAVFVAMAALMFSGCEQSTGGSGGTGTVTVSILFDEESGTDEPQNLLGILWTVHPDVSGPAFVRFTATFEATSGGAAHAPVDLSVGEPASVTLTAGTYTVTVTGYTGTEGSYVAAAIGSAEGIVVTGGTNTEASILMAPNAEVAGKGSFSYSITAPAGATGTLTIQQDGQPVGNSVTLTGGNDPVTGTIDLDAGVYLVFVYLTKDGGYTAGLVEALHIYNGMESTLTEEYEGEDFIEPQTVTSHSLTSFFAAPVTDAAPATSFGSASDQYTGTIQWKAGGINFTDTAFAAGTVYTAVVTLQANPNFTLTGVAVNSFIHENATSQTNSANDGVVTLVFPATEGAGTGTQSIVIGFNYGEITVTGAGATIYKTGTPSTLNLEVQGGYQNHVWYIDGDESAPKTGNPVTINAADYSVQQHTASFTGKKGGILYSQSVFFTVEEGVSYTVTFDGNSGSTPSSMTANSGESITLPSSTLSEYTLKGWYTAASGGIKAGDAGDTYAVTRNITLYAQWQGGAEGSPTNPLQIGTAEQLRAFGTRVTNSETTLCAELTADITVENWATIGTPGSGAAKSSKPYTGTFDGNGYTLTLSKTDTTAINMALFHTIGTEGAVRELELIVTFSGLRNIAGVAVYNFGTIESVIVKGTITSSRTGVSESDIGGIAAYNSIEKINGVQIPGKILYCLNRASISGGTCVGGIAGSFKGEMRYCGNEGAVTGGTAGGLLCTAAGFSTNNQEIFIVSDCYNTGSIHRNYSSTVNTSGGLIGGSLLPLSSWRKTSHAINNLFSYGKVTELNSPQTNIICGAIYENTAVFYHFTNLYYLAGIGDRLFGNADLNGADGLGTDEVKELVHVKSAAEFKSADMAAALNGTRKGDDAPWEYVPGNDYPTLKAAGSE